MLRVVEQSTALQMPAMQDCREHNAFNILLNSKALEQVKSIQIIPISEHFEINMLVRINGDYRWHWVSDIIHSVEYILDISNQVIDTHLSLFPEDSYVLNGWRKTISNAAHQDNFNVSVLYQELT